MVGGAGRGGKSEAQKKPSLFLFKEIRIFLVWV